MRMRRPKIMTIIHDHHDDHESFSYNTKYYYYYNNTIIILYYYYNNNNNNYLATGVLCYSGRIGATKEAKLPPADRPDHRYRRAPR